jgi:hypothetical protein
MNVKRALSLILVLLFFASFKSDLLAQQHVAIKLNISSLGIGGEAVTNIGENFTVRAGGNFFKLNFDGVNEDYRYNLNTKLSTVPVMVDWYPGGSIFHITAGGVMNFNKGDVTLTPIRNYEISGRTFTPEEIGNITGLMEYDKLSPYFGIGFGNPTTTKGLSFGFNAGAMYQSSPKVKLNASELVTSYYEEEYKDIEKTIVDKMSMLKLYPVVTFSVSYGF